MQEILIGPNSFTIFRQEMKKRHCNIQLKYCLSQETGISTYDQIYFPVFV